MDAGNMEHSETCCDLQVARPLAKLILFKKLLSLTPQPPSPWQGKVDSRRQYQNSPNKVWSLFYQTLLYVRCMCVCPCVCLGVLACEDVCRGLWEGLFATPQSSLETRSLIKPAYYTFSYSGWSQDIEICPSLSLSIGVTDLCHFTQPLCA